MKPSAGVESLAEAGSWAQLPVVVPNVSCFWPWILLACLVLRYRTVSWGVLGDPA